MGYVIARTLATVQGLRLVRHIDILHNGGHREALKIFLGMGMIRRLPSGLYCLRRDTPGPTAQAMVKQPRGVLCLMSALWIHSLLDREPDPVWMAIGPRWHKPRWQSPHTEFVRMRRNILVADFVERQTEFGPLRHFSLAATVADCFRLHHRIGDEWGRRALAESLRKGLARPEDILRAADLRHARAPVERCLRELDASAPFSRDRPPSS
jgi:predicted transcriptional regulator of viral defense system